MGVEEGVGDGDWGERKNNLKELRRLKKRKKKEMVKYARRLEMGDG